MSRRGSLPRRHALRPAGPKHRVPARRGERSAVLSNEVSTCERWVHVPIPAKGRSVAGPGARKLDFPSILESVAGGPIEAVFRGTPPGRSRRQFGSPWCPVQKAVVVGVALARDSAWLRRRTQAGLPGQGTIAKTHRLVLRRFAVQAVVTVQIGSDESHSHAGRGGEFSLSRQ